MRPKKKRLVSCDTKDRCFKPRCKKMIELEEVVLHLDEFEVIKLAHIDELQQTEIAEKMSIHRSTVSRVLASANKKIADALIHIKAIRVEGCGC
jgi:hypothetical protein